MTKTRKIMEEYWNMFNKLSDVTQENFELRIANAELSRKVDAQAAEIASLQENIEQYRMWLADIRKEQLCKK